MTVGATLPRHVSGTPARRPLDDRQGCDHGHGVGSLAEVTHMSDSIERVRTLLRKRGLKTDPDVQLMEDVICLVFLEHYFHDFAQKHDEEKLIPIVQKTWKKMTSKAHEAALRLDYAPEDLAVIQAALESA